MICDGVMRVNTRPQLTPTPRYSIPQGRGHLKSKNSRLAVASLLFVHSSPVSSGAAAAKIWRIGFL